MDWTALIKVIAPTLISLLNNTVAGLATPTLPAPPPEVIPPGTAPHPSAAIKDLQTVLNMVLKPATPLDVDGWIGPKTEKAIEDGIAKLKTYGIG